MDCKLVFLLACIALAYGLSAAEESSPATSVQFNEQVKAAVDNYMENLFSSDAALALDTESNIEEEAPVREKRRAKKCYNYPRRDKFGRVTLRRICH